MELLHHYLTVVAQTLHEEDNDHLLRKVWTSQVPRMALKQPFLLAAVLSTAALHLATVRSEPSGPQDLDKSSPSSFLYSAKSPASLTLSSDISMSGQSSPWTVQGNQTGIDVNHYVQAQRFYFNLAVRGQIQNTINLMNISPEAADATCIASLMISNQGFLVTSDSESEPVDSIYHPPVRWLTLASSSPIIIRTAREWLPRNSAIWTLIEGSHRTANRSKTTHCDENRQPYAPLLDYDTLPEPDFTPEIEEAYEKTLNFMGSIRRGILDNEPETTLARRFLEFALYAPKPFSECVDKHRPRALVILAHLFAMTKKVEGSWWFRGAAERHVYGIRNIVPPEWQWAMEGPLRDLTNNE